MGNLSTGYPVRVPTRARHSPSSQMTAPPSAQGRLSGFITPPCWVLVACQSSGPLRFQGYETVAVHCKSSSSSWLAQGGKERKAFRKFAKHLDIGHHAREYLPGRPEGTFALPNVTSFITPSPSKNLPRGRAATAGSMARGDPPRRQRR